MPWLETDPVTERKKFIIEAEGGLFSHTELCRRHGISRQKGYKWIERYEAEGPDGLVDRSHRPHSCPHATEPHVLDAALELRRARPRWGAAKILGHLAELHPKWPLPARQVLHKYIVREGLVAKRRRIRRIPHPGPPTAPFDAPNSIWSADFKGQFKTLDGVYCYPLTIQDGFSRFVIACQGLSGATLAGSQKVFTRVFREFGLPERIRTDNGVPFASSALGRLSQLSIWWIKLGILPDLIEPASPQQNGRHERMHRDLKAETTIPPAATRGAQQRRFNRFRSDFNEVRPHEAHGQRPPASVYRPSSRPFPTKLQRPEYPAHFEVRKVSTNAGIRWACERVLVSHLLAGEYVGLEQVADDIWAIYFGPVSLGWLHTRRSAILDHDGSPTWKPKRPRGRTCSPQR